MQQNADLSQFMSTSLFRNGSWSASWSEQFLFEAPKDVMYANNDQSGPFGQYSGFFRPPTTSNYTFIVAADDFAMLWIGTDSFEKSRMENIVYSSYWFPNREWYIKSYNHF